MTKKTDHASEMLANLLEQYKKKPKFEALISKVLAPQIQDLEDALFEIIGDIDLSACIGAQLDGFGRVVNQDRNGQDDDTYRVYLQAKMRANRSTGTLEEIIEILVLLIGSTPTVDILEPPETDPATIEMVVTSDLAGDGFVIGSLVVQAKDAGVRLLITFHPAGSFRLDEIGRGFDKGNKFGGTAGG